MQIAILQRLKPVDEIKIPCPFCEQEFKVPKKWIRENKRVFCTSCCKAFDVELPEEIEIPDHWGNDYD